MPPIVQMKKLNAERLNCYLIVSKVEDKPRSAACKAIIFSSVTSSFQAVFPKFLRDSRAARGD